MSGFSPLPWNRRPSCSLNRLPVMRPLSCHSGGVALRVPLWGTRIKASSINGDVTVTFISPSQASILCAMWICKRRCFPDLWNIYPQVILHCHVIKRCFLPHKRALVWRGKNQQFPSVADSRLEQWGSQTWTESGNINAESFVLFCELRTRIPSGKLT